MPEKLKMPPPDTALNRRMAAGHLMRTGHRLVSVLVSDDGAIWQVVRECCGEKEED